MQPTHDLGAFPLYNQTAHTHTRTAWHDTKQLPGDLALGIFVGRGGVTHAAAVLVDVIIHDPP